MKLLKTIAFGLLAGCIFSTASQVSWARPVKIWTKAELLEKADLVVIATPIGSQEGSGTPSADNGWIVGVETTFRVEAILKEPPKQTAGSVPKATVVGPNDQSQQKRDELRITVSHYRHATGHELQVDGTTYVRFDGQPREYLLFLKKTSAAGYEPLSGQFDPSFSVFIVGTYSDPTPAKPAKPVSAKKER